MAYNTGELNFDEAREAFVQLFPESGEDRRYILRMCILHGYNDRYGRGSGLIPPEDDRMFFVENCRALAEMPQTSPLLMAELFREIGEFDRCISILDSIQPETDYERLDRERIREHACRGDADVFLHVDR